MENLPFYIEFVFLSCLLFTAAMFLFAANFNKALFAFMVGWILLQSVLSANGFYLDGSSRPPHFIFAVLPPVITILTLFLSKKGRLFIDNLSLKSLTIIHIVRIPVELVLFWLYQHKGVPVQMTFEGRNFDIFSGITAPVIFYFAFFRGGINKNVLLLWNILCLLLVLNIAITGTFYSSVGQGNITLSHKIAMRYFPFTLLPAFIVPTVLLAHLASIRKLLRRDNLQLNP